MNAITEFNAEEQQVLKDMVARFIESEVAPHYEQWERDEIMPREIWHKLGEAGFLCADIPEEYGGPRGT
jgi:acyl-CoA dehydrogenase